MSIAEEAANSQRNEAAKKRANETLHKLIEAGAFAPFQNLAGTGAEGREGMAEEAAKAASKYLSVLYAGLIEMYLKHS